MASDKKTLEELHRTGELTTEALLRLTRGGALRGGRRYSPAEIRSALNELGDVLAGKGLPTTEEPALEGGINLVRIFDPSKYVEYVTVAVNGKALVTTDASGKLDSGKMMDDEDHLLRLIIEAGMPVERTVTVHRVESGKGGKLHKPRKMGTPTKPVVMYDPYVETYLRESGRALVFAVLEGNTPGRAATTASSRDLERLLDPELFRRVTSKGFQVKVQPMTDFLAASKSKLGAQERIYLREILETQEVTALVSQFIREFKSEGIEDLLAGNVTDPNVYEGARKVYAWFGNHPLPNVEIQRLVGALRYSLLEAYSQQVETGNMTKEEYDRRREISRKWRMCALGADYVRGDPWVQRQIIPLFTDRDEGVKAKDVNFEAIRRIGKHVIYPDDTLFDPVHFRLIVRGLWMFGHLRGRGKGSEEGESLERERGGWGVEVEYIQPMNHLILRYRGYDPVLKNSFEQLLQSGEFREELVLEITEEYQSLGRKLYREIPDARRERLFSHLHDASTPLTPEGDHLGRILRMYVAVNRDYFKEKSRKR